MAKNESDYTYLGSQKVYKPKYQKMELYNCSHCGSTVAEQNLQTHIILNHPEVWDEKIKLYSKKGGKDGKNKNSI